MIDICTLTHLTLNLQVPMLIILVFNTLFLIWVILVRFPQSRFFLAFTLFSIQIVILKLRQKAVTAADHDRRHWKAAKVKFTLMWSLLFGLV